MPIWRHQEDAIAWAWERTAILWHHGMGSGKTRTTLEFIARKMRERGVSRILVCCPKAVIAAWAKQCGLWIDGVRVLLLDKGTSKQKDGQVAAALADTSPLIVVCNYETVWRLKSVEKVKWDVIVHDEIHRLKSASGVTSRWAGKLCKANPQAIRIGLSGTLIPHSILDAWAIYRAVESPECPTFGTSYTLHKATYAIFPHGQNFPVGWKNLPQAHAKIAATTHHVKSADVLDLPPIQFIDVPANLDPSEARLYREIEREFCAVCAQGTVTPANALVQLLRLQQICGGFVRFDETQKASQIAAKPAKAAVLADMLEDLPSTEPLVVFCRFSSDIAAVKAVCGAAGRTVSELSGQVRELADWQAGKTNVLVTQIQAGGIGIDLTRAAYCWFYSLGYSLAEYEQAVARLHRPGQEKKTVIYHLVATIDGCSTVDGRVYEALRERKDILNVIVDGYQRGHNLAPVGAR